MPNEFKEKEVHDDPTNNSFNINNKPDVPPHVKKIDSVVVESLLKAAGVEAAQKENPALPAKLAPAYVIVLPSHEKHHKEEEEEALTEDFVKESNSRIGSQKNVLKAGRLLKKMRILAGLDPTNKEICIDIPQARKGLCLLSSLDNYPIKMAALKSLNELLDKDSLEKMTSIDLISLAIMLTKRNQRELMQAEIIDVQEEIAKAYGKVALLIQRHYAKKHINAITKELKEQLIHTTEDLQNLNRQENPKLRFEAAFALEGFKRIVDDRKELFDLLERFLHAFLAIGNIVPPNNVDVDRATMHLFASFKDLNRKNPQNWYNGVLILRELGKSAKSNPAHLSAVQMLIREKALSFNWRFLFAAQEVLTDIALNGKTQKIRKAAFEGHKMLSDDFPGVLSFYGFEKLPLKTSYSPVKHLSAPKKKDLNPLIRRAACENLIKIICHSKDTDIQEKARKALLIQSKKEKDPSVRFVIDSFVPNQIDNLKAWIKGAKQEIKKPVEEGDRLSVSAAMPTPALVDEISKSQFSLIKEEAKLSPSPSFTASIELTPKKGP